jgi:hypothetical protein
MSFLINLDGTAESIMHMPYVVSSPPGEVENRKRSECMDPATAQAVLELTM